VKNKQRLPKKEVMMLMGGLTFSSNCCGTVVAEISVTDRNCPYRKEF
jgi:hypothetical protein